MSKFPGVERLRSAWHGFSDGRVGHRFRDRYHGRRRSGQRSRLSTALMLSGGVFLMLAGLVMLITPGPGWVTLFLGLGLVAGESLPTARLMDRAEVRGRKLSRRVARFWRGLRKDSPGAAWSVAASLVLACAVALGYGGYLLASAY